MINLNRPKIMEQFEELQKSVNNCSTPKCNNDCSSCDRKVPLLQLMNYVLELERMFIPSIVPHREKFEAKKSELINFSEFNEMVKTSKLKEEGLNARITIDCFFEHHFLK